MQAHFVIPATFLLINSAIATILTGPSTNAVNGHLYVLLAPTNWTAAQFEAMRMGGDLATINDSAELDWVWQTFGHYGGPPRNLWIGLNDVDRDGAFAWASGEPVDYINWSENQPDNYGGWEHYGMIANWSGQMNDFPDLPGPGYGADALPYGVVEIGVSGRQPSFGDEIEIIRWDPSGSLTWTNRIAANATYRVECAANPAGPWERLKDMNDIQATQRSVTVAVTLTTARHAFYRVHWLDASLVDVKPPIRFVEDAALVSPGQAAQLTVLDALGRTVPASNLVYGITGYWSLSPDRRVSVDSNGVAHLTSGALVAPYFAFRCLASCRGLVTTNQVFIVAYPQDASRTVFKTEEWRLFVPQEWISNAVNQFPDFGHALDVGRRAQKELMNWTYAETWNLWDVNRPAVSWESIAEDPNTCAYSGNPIGFSRGCFFAGFDGAPWWPAIFHELGHNSASLVDKIMYGELTYGAGLYSEGDANLLGRWSGQVLLADPTISALTKTSIQRHFDENIRIATTRLAEWEAQTTALADRNGDWLWEGIHVRIGELHGRDYFHRYVRAWRRDNSVRDMLAGANPPGDWYARVTLEQRCTFMVAAVSAAVRQDLRSRFVAWRFPLQDALFEALYSHLAAAMDEPL